MATPAPRQLCFIASPTATDGSITWDMGIAVFIPAGVIGTAQGPSLMQFGRGM